MSSSALIPDILNLVFEHLNDKETLVNCLIVSKLFHAIALRRMADLGIAPNKTVHCVLIPLRFAEKGPGYSRVVKQLEKYAHSRVSPRITLAFGGHGSMYAHSKRARDIACSVQVVRSLGIGIDDAFIARHSLVRKDTGVKTRNIVMATHQQIQSWTFYHCPPGIFGVSKLANLKFFHRISRYYNSNVWSYPSLFCMNSMGGVQVLRTLKERRRFFCENS